MNYRIEEIAGKILEAGLARRNEIRGCTVPDIEWLEKKVGVPFPKIYREFLMHMGMAAGAFFRGSCVFYQHIPFLRENAEAMILEFGFEYRLEACHIVFMMHQGYICHFFDACNSGDDPPIIEIGYETPVPKVISTSLSEYLVQNIDWTSGVLPEKYRRQPD